MDLLNMTHRAQIHKFIRRLNRGNFYLSTWQPIQISTFLLGKKALGHGV